MPTTSKLNFIWKAEVYALKPGIETWNLYYLRMNENNLCRLSFQSDDDNCIIIINYE